MPLIRATRLAYVSALVLLVLSEWLAIGGLTLGVAPDAPRPVRGRLWQADLRLPQACQLSFFLDCAADSESHPAASTLRMFDARGELGPAHSTHRDIETDGNGRFSHWGDTVYFSFREASAAGQARLMMTVAPAPTIALRGLSLTLFLAGLVASGFARRRTAGWPGVGRGAVRLCGMGGTAIVVLAFAAMVAPWEVPVTVTSQGRAGGELWTASVHPARLPLIGILSIPSDSSRRPEASTLRLWLGQLELGPAHSVHADIAAAGNGRYSHWNDALLFSLPQAAAASPDPPALRATASPRVPPAVILVALLFATPMWIALARRVRTRPGRTLALFDRLKDGGRLAWPIVGIVGAVHYGLYLAEAPRSILLESDSDSYLVFAPMTTAGYSLIVHAILALFRSPYAIVLLQFAVALIAIMAFCRSLERTFSWSVALPVGLLFVIKDGLNILHYSLLTDSLTTSCILLTAAALVDHMRHPSIRGAVTIFALLAVALAVRPAAAFMVPLTFLVAIIVWRTQRGAAVTLAVAAASSLVIPTALQRATEYALRSEAVDRYVMRVWSGVDAQTSYWTSPQRAAGAQLGYMLFLQVRLGLSDGQMSQYPVETAALARALRDERAQFAGAASWRAKYSVFEDGYSAATVKRTVRDLHEREISAADGWLFQDNLLGTIAVETIQQAPQHYLLITAIKLSVALTERMLGTWATERRGSYAESPAIAAWRNQYAAPLGTAPATSRSSAAARVDRYRGFLVPAVSVAGLLGVGLLPWILVGRVSRPQMLTLAVLSTAYAGYTLTVCMVQAPIWRYGEPISAIGLASLCGWIREGWVRLKRSRNT